MPKYLCFTKDANLEIALQTFRDRYHMEPKEHKFEHGILWIGPVPGSDDQDFRVILEEGLSTTLLDQHDIPMQLIMF